MATLLAVPILGFLLILQSTLVSRVQLLHGTADLLLLALLAWTLQERVTSAWRWALIAGFLITIGSAVPPGSIAIAYLLATALALFLKKRVWQTPILAMFLSSFAGTLIVHGASLAGRLTEGVTLPLVDVFNLITLPSLLLNLLLALPMFIVISDLAKWVHPKEMDV
jgi:cell shape-determining protein MreD